MKILYVTNIPSPYKVEFLNRLAKYCELSVYFERMTASDRNSKWGTSENWGFKTIKSSGILIGTDSSLSFDLIRHLKKNKYDIIVFAAYHTITSMLTMEYLNQHSIRFILSSDGGFIANENKIKYLIKKHFIGMAGWYLSPGGKTDEYLMHYGALSSNISRYSFTSLSRKDVIDARTQRKQKNETREHLKLSKGDKIIVLTVGQMIKRKGIDVLLNSMCGISDKYEVIIIGGKPTDEYLQIINKHNLKNIRFVDFLTKDQLKEYYAAADLFVFPTREDIWGLVVIEAMAYGLPVITTDRCNAGVELQKYGIAEIIPTESVDSLQKSIITFSNNKQHDYYDIAMKYTYENVVSEHLKAFNQFGSIINKCAKEK